MFYKNLINFNIFILFCKVQKLDKKIENIYKYNFELRTEWLNEWSPLTR